MVGGAGAVASLHDLSEKAIRDESVLGRLPGGLLYGAFPDDAAA